MKKNYILANSLEYGGKKYAIEDTIGILPLQDFELEPNFYGGRANKIAQTKTDGVYMVLEQLKPIDLLIDTKKYKKQNKNVSSEKENDKAEKENDKAEKENDKKTAKK